MFQSAGIRAVCRSQLGHYRLNARLCERGKTGVQQDLSDWVLPSIDGAVPNFRPTARYEAEEDALTRNGLTGRDLEFEIHPAAFQIAKVAAIAT